MDWKIQQGGWFQLERSKIHHRVLVFDPLCPSFVYFALHPTLPKETQSNQVGQNTDLNILALYRVLKFCPIRKIENQLQHFQVQILLD